MRHCTWMPRSINFSAQLVCPFSAANSNASIPVCVCVCVRVCVCVCVSVCPCVSMHYR